MRVDEHIELRWENMLAGIRRQGEWLRTGPRQLWAEAADVHGDPPGRCT